ncbi:MAG TPA: endonuclease MutS2 [Anaerolineales bacterium]|nr:endonuclease MutS2 [Anaerolineales bacterium]
MDEKTLKTLEYDKVLENLAARCAFSASKGLALDWRPTAQPDTARDRQAETGEARRLLAQRPSTSIGGARDIRESAGAAAHGVVLDPNALLDVRSTLIAARELKRTFEHLGDVFPHLAETAGSIPVPHGLVDSISRVLTDRGEVHDNASQKLATIRRELRIVHDRLLDRMQRMLSDPKVAPYLQDNLVTIRDGRYVLPLRADFKGKVKAVVHDQSSSGATLFVEPLGVVEHNNKYRQLQLDERDEVRRILAELSAQVGEHAAELGWLVEGVAALDLVFARAKLAEDMDATEPVLLDLPRSVLENGHPGTVVRLYGARHPLLDRATVVPIDVAPDDQTFAVIITGPNTGGKTVSLKTVGLLVLMAQSGLQIPAGEGCELSCFKDVFADIGDEQSIEQSLSTFSGHITNIIRILGLADHRSLVILDELGSGTDPQEGARLAMAILTTLLGRAITTFVATHYPEMKSFAAGRKGVVNASVEFDVETLRPTYHLIVGLPGASNALTIAQRLGLPDEIISLAREGVPAEEQEAGDMLGEIHRQRDAIRRARADADRARQETLRVREELTARLEKIEDERRGILENARKEAQAQVARVEEELRELRRKLAVARQPLDVIEEVEEQVFELEESVAVPVERAPERELPGGGPAVLDRPVRLGDRVRLRSLGTQGVVSALAADEAEVQIGIMRVRTRLAELEPLGGAAAEEERPRPNPEAARGHPSPGVELDLRGLRADEAIDRLGDYLDAAYLSQMPYVRIIHGKGTGKLREAVQQALRGNANVSSFELGGDGEGGEGVTVVKFQK